MSNTNTFIRGSEDCPSETGIVPVSSRPLPPAHVIQYYLLAEQKPSVPARLHAAQEIRLGASL